VPKVLRAEDFSAPLYNFYLCFFCISGIAFGGLRTLVTIVSVDGLSGCWIKKWGKKVGMLQPMECSRRMLKANVGEMKSCLIQGRFSATFHNFQFSSSFNIGRVT
jgi:hypothetical protein